jgi:hypothetical protein
MASEISGSDFAGWARAEWPRTTRSCTCGAQVRRQGARASVRAEQERRSLAAEPRGPCDVASHEVQTCSLQLVERSGIHRGQEPERRIKRASLQACLRRGQHAQRVLPDLP